MSIEEILLETRVVDKLCMFDVDEDESQEWKRRRVDAEMDDHRRTVIVVKSSKQEDKSRPSTNTDSRVEMIGTNLKNEPRHSGPELAMHPFKELAFEVTG